MFELIKKMFMGLLISIVNASNHIKCFSLSNPKCEIQPTVVNLHPNEYSQKFGLNKFLSLKKLKIMCRGHMLLMILMEKKFLERFSKTNCKKQIKKNLFNCLIDKKDIP